MKNVISGPEKPIQDTIHIPSSKSISNRMLIIRSLANSSKELKNLSDSDDTYVLKNALEGSDTLKDVGHAGTAMRFLTAYLAVAPGAYTLTGSHRMKERPIGSLVTALQELGAQIDYVEKEGYPPLFMGEGALNGGSIEIEAGISSQFISALMMIGPVLEGGLRIQLKGEVVSATYIEMTLSLMNQNGIDAVFDGAQILVPQQPYKLQGISVESDWSGASYWYQIAALLPGSSIKLPYLVPQSLQGDAVLVDMFEALGVKSQFQEDGLLLHSHSISKPEHFEYDFTGCPDLVQTCAVTLCSMGIPFRFFGTRTLRVKETDRIAALESELKKFGFLLNSEEAGAWMEWDGSRCEPLADPVIQTFHDHRMAMAFAPLAIGNKPITIEDPEVVTKSYPGFWKDLKKAGFKVSAS
jgi:3-phosphoshikimate 1-carboxyvinyltransferase